MTACISSIKLMSHNNKGMVEQWDWPNMGCILCLLCFLGAHGYFTVFTLPKIAK